MKQTKISIQDAFKIGYRGFFKGESEFKKLEGTTELGEKEYTRGWQQAYFKNIEVTKAREANFRRKMRNSAKLIASDTRRKQS